MKSIYKKLIVHGLVVILLFGVFVFLTGGEVSAVCDPAKYQEYPACTSIQTGDLGFQIPSLGDILTFAIRAFFVIAGLAALFYMLIGAFAWVTSGGDKDAVTAAREKIQAAVIGMILIVAVLAVIWTLEQVIFKRRICLGLSCPLTLPGLIETKTGENCCTCVSNTGGLCTAVNAGNAGNGCTNVVIDSFDPTKTCK